MTAYLSPIGNSQFEDANGNPLTGGKVYTYKAGSSTPEGTWTTSAGNVAQPNPIILNSLGATANPIYLTAGVTYKIVIKDSADVSTLYTFDNIAGINDPAAIASPTPEWVDSLIGANRIYYISATAFSLSEDKTALLPPGIRIRTTNTSGYVYSTVISSNFSSNFSGGFTNFTVLNDGVTVLDGGLSALSYSALSPSSTSLPNSQASRNAMGIRQGRNLLINGAFLVNQDNTASTSVILTPGQYWRDGWKAHSAGCTLSYDGGANTITITAGHLVQVIENPLKSNATDYYTLSIENQTSCVVNTGQGAPSTTGAITARTLPYFSPTKFTDTGGDLFVIFGPGTFNATVQLERGRSANLFEYKSFQQDLADCQRYYEIVGSIGASANGAAGVGFGASRGFSVKKRAVPTATVITAPSYINASGFAVFQISDSGFMYAATTTAAGGSNYGNATAGVVSFAARL